MIWHIFKKDWSLLWPYVAGLTVVQIVIEIGRHHAVMRGDDLGLVDPLGLLSLVALVFVVALVAHQDPLPGTRQDWLTRPIKRADLLLAKILFLVTLVHGPTFVANTVDVLATGFALPQALGVAAASGLSILASVTLVTLAVGAVTRTMTEFVVGGIIVSLILEAASMLFSAITSTGCGPTCETSIEWVATIGQSALLAIAALAVLALQYFRRDATRYARWIVAATPVLLAAMWNLPWDTAFAIQEAATGAVEPQDRVTIELDGAPQSPLAPPNAGEQALVSAARASLAGSELGKIDLRARRRASSTDTVITLPLRVSGLRAGEVVWTDRVVFRLFNADGRVFHGAGDELEIRADGSAAQTVQQTLSVPANLFDAVRDTDLRLELDYWITSLEPAAAITLPVQDGKAELLDAKCSTGLRRNGAAVRLACIAIASPPSCYAAALESRTTGERDPDVLICDPDYRPYEMGPRLFKPFAVTLPLTNGAAAANPLLHVSAYTQRAHSTSRLVVPRLRLAEWAVAPP